MNGKHGASRLYDSPGVPGMGPAQWAGPISTRERVFLWKDQR